MKTLAKIIDYFKARNPKVFVAAVTVLETVKVACIAIISVHLELQEIIPALESVEFLKAVPIYLAIALGTITEALTLLTGSSTKAAGKSLLRIKKGFVHEDGKTYQAGNLAFFPDAVADGLVKNNFAELINT